MREKENAEFGKMKRNLIIGTRKTHKYVENQKVSDYLVPYTCLLYTSYLPARILFQLASHSVMPISRPHLYCNRLRLFLCAETRDHLGSLHAVCVWRSDVFSHKLSNGSAARLDAGCPQYTAH